MIETKTISLTPIADLADEMQNYSPVSIAIGPRNEYCVLLTKEHPPLLQGSFPQTVTEEAYAYKVVIFGEGGKRILDLPEERWNYHYVQPIDDGHVLLAGARSVYRSVDDIEKNARVYDGERRCIRSFCLGDGIQDLYVTPKNTIWTSYFDEGVFGNFGWDEPIGSKGLIHWDAFGEQLEWHDPEGQYYISDCYAMNVVSDNEVWFYYYTDFQIGVRSDGHTTYYKPDVQGASGFAMHREVLFMNGGYGDQEQYYELGRNGLHYETKRRIRFLNRMVRSCTRKRRAIADVNCYS